MSTLRSALAFSLALVTSCGSKASVAVTPSIGDAKVTLVGASVLASSLQGSFRLHLELGVYAPGATDVTLVGFELVGASDQQSLVLLKTVAAPPASSYHLEPGGQRDVNLTIAEKEGATAQVIADPAPLCAAKTVQIAASIHDSASGQTTPTHSAPLVLGGCP
ncbi:MAG TPA: hypothetical protein VJT73_10035 [Polyangiaceae bacterium]|nr:hypothetical protein [Polyangiaceae bacterium]